ncbi:hypothetical protein SDC9_111273 [bioreactor metagenome]|uniref:Uncharacterized protein n=1 Tax=bioreactor metagenome TaxID=1076179 RepID=A0A645BGB4_9ZZZZ
MTVFAPGIARARFRHDKTEVRICDHVDPGRRRMFALQSNAVFFAVGTKPANAIVI